MVKALGGRGTGELWGNYTVIAILALKPNPTSVPFPNHKLLSKHGAKRYSIVISNCHSQSITQRQQLALTHQRLSS